MSDFRERKNTRVTLYLNPDVIKVINDGLPPSSSVSKHVRMLMQHSIDNEFEEVSLLTAIEITEDKLNIVKARQIELNTSLNMCNTTFSTLDKIRLDYIDQLQTQRRVSKLSGLIQILNRTIISNEFNLGIIESVGGPAIDEILSVKPDFDLASHVGRLQHIMED